MPPASSLCRLLMPLLIASLPAAALADGTDMLGVLLKDYASITRDLHKAEQAQAALLKQKTAIDTKGVELVGRQQGLNADTEVHNSVAERDQQELDARKARCANAACGKGPKKLGKITLATNVGGKLEESQQTLLDLEFGQYSQAANDWTAQEEKNTTALNALYRALNDWADRADAYMGSGPFRDEVQADHAGRSCAHNKLPGGTLSIQELQLYSVDAERCLRYVASRRKPRS